MAFIKIDDGLWNLISPLIPHRSLQRVVLVPTGRTCRTDVEVVVFVIRIMLIVIGNRMETAGRSVRLVIGYGPPYP